MVVWPLFPKPSRLTVRFFLLGHVDFKDFILVLIKQRLNLCVKVFGLFGSFVNMFSNLVHIDY